MEKKDAGWLGKIKEILKLGKDEEAEELERIESAKVTSSRLGVLKRMRQSSPTTPDYKRESVGPEGEAEFI